MQIIPIKVLQKYWEHVKRHWNLLKALSCPYLVSCEHQKKIMASVTMLCNALRNLKWELSKRLRKSGPSLILDIFGLLGPFVS